MPFITEELYQIYFKKFEKNKSIHLSSWPEKLKITQNKDDKKIITILMGFNSEIWKKKKQSGKNLRDKIEGIKIPKELKAFGSDLIATHNII